MSAPTERIVLGVDPGLANTGWGVISQQGAKLECLAYGCISTSKDQELSLRLKKVHDQIDAVIRRFQPSCVGIETVWFGVNTQSAFATGQARGAALVACATHELGVAEFSPRQIKLAVVGTGTAEKDQVQYMVKQLLSLEKPPHPDHASDALAAAICYTTHEGFAALVKSALITPAPANAAPTNATPANAAPTNAAPTNAALTNAALTDTVPANNAPEGAQ